MQDLGGGPVVPPRFLVNRLDCKKPAVDIKKSDSPRCWNKRYLPARNNRHGHISGESRGNK